MMQASEKDSDPYKASDRASDRIAKRMRRYKRRLRDHHNGSENKFHAALEAQYAILAPEPEEHDDTGVDAHNGQPLVVAEMWMLPLAMMVFARGLALSPVWLIAMLGQTGRAVAVIGGLVLFRERLTGNQLAGIALLTAGVTLSLLS